MVSPVSEDPVRTPAQMPADAGAAALRTVVNIMEQKWRLSGAQCRRLLGSLGESTYFRWKSEPERANVDHDLLERLSYLLGIYKALAIIYSDEALATSWLFRDNDNPLFGGGKPIERLLAGNVSDLFLVRRHLDARRGAWG